MYLGIEIGGTKLQLGLGDGNGVLSGVWRGKVDVAAGGEGIRQQIIAAVPELLAQAAVDRSRLIGIGVGFGGPVDDRTHTIVKSHQIDGWEHFPLADWISRMFDLPVALGNDADVAGLAEARFGAGKGVSPVFYITIGSGIGGGLIIDGQIYRGCGLGAAEIGHLRIAGSTASTDPSFVLEQGASGWGIASRAQRGLRTSGDQGSALLRLVAGKIQAISAQHVAETAEQGDPFSLRILHETWRDLAQAIRQMITLLNPRRIVIGGGVSLMGEKLLFEPLRTMVAQDTFPPFAGCCDIVAAALGEEVVVHGALALARGATTSPQT